MTTDDERREVAKRLRMNVGKGVPLLLNVAFAAFRVDPVSLERVVTSDEAALKLADLIDPDCGTVEAPTSPVPECDGTRERLARALGIDLPALLALADEMRRNTQGMLSDDKVDASDIWYYEHLLRKACGEEVQ